MKDLDIQMIKDKQAEMDKALEDFKAKPSDGYTLFGRKLEESKDGTFSYYVRGKDDIVCSVNRPSKTWNKWVVEVGRSNVFFSFMSEGSTFEEAKKAMETQTESRAQNALTILDLVLSILKEPTDD